MTSQFIKKRAFIFTILLWINFPSKAELILPSLFSDHMILQRHMPIPIWGKASPGMTVSLSFNTQSTSVITNDNGEWKIIFEAMSAGGPYEIKIQGGEKTKIIKDVLIGEVWLCSGQSNMEFTLQSSDSADYEYSTFVLPEIRLFHLKKKHDMGNAPFNVQQMEEINKGNIFNQPKWELCNFNSAKLFSAVALYFGKEIYDSLRVPIGLIQNAVGGSPIQSWINKESLASHPQLSWLAEFDTNHTWINIKNINPWLVTRAFQNWGDLWNQSMPIPQHPFAPSYLYESALKPLAPYAFRGVIWYQGESNATHPGSYKSLFETMVRDWRLLWKQGDFPFYFVQLPRIGTRSRWPEFRAAQEACLEIKNTGMVVTIDQGHKIDVHPKEKSIIGKRLANLALVKSFGKSHLAESPKISSWNFKPDDGKIEINFTKVGKGLAVVGKSQPQGFYMEGYSKDGMDAVVLPVENIMINNQSIELSVPAHIMITSIKYAWAPFPESNIINSVGLPLSPFKIELPGND